MAPTNFLRLFTIFSLALLNVSFGTLPVNALAVERGHMARGINHAHAGVTKKRRDSSKQCKPRPSAPASSKAPTHNNVVVPTSTPVSQTQTQPSPTPTSSGSSDNPSGGSKVMGAWANNEQSSFCNVFGNTKVQYYYNWKALEDSGLGDCEKLHTIIFVATIHDESQLYLIDQAVKKGTKYFKFFNEANIKSQANVDATWSATLWIQHMQPLAGQGITLIGPSVTTDDTGFKWMQTFMDNCKTCSFHAMDLHYYGLEADDFKASVKRFHDAFGLTLWITEIGCQDYSPAARTCTVDIFNVFFYAVRDFCEQTNWIAQYSWFAWFTTQEIPDGVNHPNSMLECPDNKPGPDCHPTSMGYIYLNP